MQRAASLHTRSTPMPLAMAKRPVMEQVEVDDPHVQEQLGKIQVSSFAPMNFQLSMVFSYRVSGS